MPTVASNIQTIPRNHKKRVADVFRRAKQWWLYDRINQYRGSAVPAKLVENRLIEGQPWPGELHQPVLTVGISAAGLPQATVTIHDELWYSSELEPE